MTQLIRARSWRRSAMAALLAAGWCTGPAQAQDAALESKVDAIVAKALATPNTVGLSVAVGKGDQVILAKGYGKADLEFDVPVGRDTMFRIGSVTKQFTAACVMKLVEQGKLSLDDTIGKVYPDYPAAAKDITLRQLLTHTSGIWSYTEDESIMTRDAALEMKPAEMVDRFKNHPLDFTPGTKWHYSNSAYYLLGEIIAKASGKSYESYVTNDLIKPAGLTRTRYDSNREIIKDRAQGYSGGPGGAMVNDMAIGADVPGAAGSLISSAEGLVRWNIALAAGKVVSPESYKMMTATTVLPDGKDTHYGFGLQIDSWESKPRVSHGGGIFGFTSHLSYLPTDGLTVAVISNSDRVDPARIAESIERAALGLAEFTPKDLDVTADEASHFTGVYAFEDLPLELTVVAREGKLFVTATGQGEMRLLSQGQGEFRASFDPTVKLTFAKADGPSPSVTLTQGGEHLAKRK